jgi:glycosyltransferase involved in cell wall biosynthesis
MNDIGHPEVSVIMSVYDGEKHLRESIESVLSQTLFHFEFIIVDDGSKDSSSQIIQSYSDSRIKFIQNQCNIGLTRSLNAAIKEAKGKYIARHDCDDISLPHRLEKQKQELDKNESILAATGVIHIFNDSNINVKYIPPVQENVFNKRILGKNLLIHSSIMFKNHEGVHYRDKFYYAQDYDLYLRLLSEGNKITVFPEFLLKYRISKNTISSKKRVHQLLFMKKAKEFFDERMLYGKDNYDSFDPSQILSLDVEQFRDIDLLRAQLNTDFSSGYFKELRQLYKKYFRLANFDRYILLYVSSFLPHRFVAFINKIFLKIIYQSWHSSSPRQKL